MRSKLHLLSSHIFKSKGGYRSNAPIRAVRCKKFANVAGAVSLDGLPSTNPQQRARTSIRKHYPPDVGTSKKFDCSCALALDRFSWNLFEHSQTSAIRAFGLSGQLCEHTRILFANVCKRLARHGADRRA
jgi:hypothetical protein